MELNDQNSETVSLRGALRHKWLSAHFGEVGLYKTGKGVIATLPQAYILSVEPVSLFFNLMTGRTETNFTPIPLEICAPSVELALSGLTRAVFSGRVSLYKPKPGQSEDIIEPGRPYRVVRQNHAAHSHDNAAHLIDFGRVEMIAGVYMRKHGLHSRRHSHLLIG